jgi:transcriptional regulator with XRE-family HTH domain
MKCETHDASNPLVDTKEIGARIASIRKGKGLTQAELADRVGISRLLISDYERGKVRLYADVLAKISAALGVSNDALLAATSDMNEDFMPTLKIAKRIKALEKLPDTKQKAILKTLDDLIRANQ